MSFGQVEIKKGIRVTGFQAWSAYGAPNPILLINFFTFNRRKRRFEVWGHREWLTSEPLQSGDGDSERSEAPGDFIGPPEYSPVDPNDISSRNGWYPGPVADDYIPADGFSIMDDPIFDIDDFLPADEFSLSDQRRPGLYPDSWPWWLPYGYRIYRSGHKGDVIPGTTGTEHETLARRHGGHKGWTDQGPYIGPHWRFGDHDQHEVYLGTALTSAPGWPSTTDHSFDESGRIGYRHHFPTGHGLVWVGAGSYFQWTDDSIAAEGSPPQQNPFGQSHGDHHLIPYVDIGYEWKHTTLPIAIEFGIELDHHGTLLGPTIGITYSPGSP